MIKQGKSLGTMTIQGKNMKSCYILRSLENISRFPFVEAFYVAYLVVIVVC